MRTSKLITSLTTGKWMASHPELLIPQVALLGQLSGEKPFLNTDHTSLAETKPILHEIFKASGFRGDSYDDIPQGSIAVIPLIGVMLKYSTRFSYGTEEIAKAIISAAGHKNITGIILDIDSGGGAVDAIAPITDAITKCNKPVIALCDLCASAAYWVAASCDKIIAKNRISSEFGSIGVMFSFYDLDPYFKEVGIIPHTIYSNKSEFKNHPFEKAKEGKYDEIKKEELDPLAIKFQEHVKRSRGSKLKQETKGILQGRMFGPEDAKSNGLIDEIGNFDLAVKMVSKVSKQALINNYLKQA